MVYAAVNDSNALADECSVAPDNACAEANGVDRNDGGNV